MIYHHYYGLKDNIAYETLATSLYNDDIIAELEHACGYFSENTGYSTAQFHLIPINGYQIIGCTTDHKIEALTISRYFSHQYVLDKREMEKDLLNLPQIINSLTFAEEPREVYQLKSDSLPYQDHAVLVTLSQDVLKPLIQAAIHVTLQGELNRLFIIAENWTNDFDVRAREVMAQICQYLPLQARRKLGFISYANSAENLDPKYNIIFCKAADVLSFKQKYEDTSYFFFLDQKKCFPPLEINAYVQFAVTHTDGLLAVNQFCDSKLTDDFKDSPVFYDVLCDFLHLEAQMDFNTYKECRESVFPALKDLYDMKIASQEMIDFCLKSELDFLSVQTVFDVELILSVFLTFYQNKAIHSSLFFDLMLLLEQHLSADGVHRLLDKMNLSQEYDLYLQSKDKPQPVQQSEPEEAAPAKTPPPKTKVDTPVEAVPIPIPTEVPESDVQAKPDLPNPQEIAKELLKTADIISFIDNQSRLYQTPLYQELAIQSAIAEYLSSAIRCCTNKEDLKIVLLVSNKLTKYQNDDVDRINQEIMNLIRLKLNEFEQATAPRPDSATTPADAVEIAKQHLLKQFHKIFLSTRITAFTKLPYMDQCAQLGLTKQELDAYAQTLYQQTSSILALLFICCEYDLKGNLINCDISVIDRYFSNMVTALTDRYTFLRDLASLDGLNSTDIIGQGIADYVEDNKDLLIKAKKEKDALYYLLNNAGAVKHHDNRYLKFGIALAALVGVVVILAVVLTTFQ